MSSGARLVVICLLAANAATGVAHADDATPDLAADDLGVVESPYVPAITVRVGALVPVLLIYELPGPSAGVTLGWQRSERMQLVARVEAGAVFFDGAQRYLGTLGGGGRFSPWPRWRVSPWVQLGIGMTGYVERISLALPERTASATDEGLLLTADLAIGVRVARRWELGFGWDHIVWPSPDYEVYTGSESLPYRGTAMSWIGVQL